MSFTRCHQKFTGKIVQLAVEEIRCRPVTCSGILRASIAEFGILQPLVVARSGGAYIVLEGRQRLQVARETGLREVPALCVDLSEANKRELVRWNPDLIILGKIENPRVAELLEEAARRGIISPEDIGHLGHLDEVEVVASLREIWSKKEPSSESSD